MVELNAPAKVNLFLRVLDRESSGYHQLESLFASLEFGDRLTLEKADPGISLVVDGPEICAVQENLVYRGADAFFKLRGPGEGVKIHLQKRIPMGGGLGGGSSDAGATLRGLTDLFPGTVGGSQLLQIAGDLGSDVPFFLYRASLAMARGRGDIIQPLPPLPEVPVLLAVPPLSVATPEAYRLLAQTREGRTPAGASREYSSEDFSTWEGLAELAENDFEEVIFSEFPLLERIRRAIRDSGALISLMSGSGSTLFGVYADETKAVSAKLALSERFPETQFLVTRTESRTGDLQDREGLESKVGD